jgi:protein-L-isoaspartate(D-aspartate) O-methyltransferase
MKYERLRKEMVQCQLAARGISDPRVLSAMAVVPRHLFVSEALRDQAYSNYPLPIGDQQTISQPLIVATMSQALALSPEARVLELGTGSGYQAAILAQFAYRVYTIERLYSLYRRARQLFDALRYFNIVARYADGSSGWPAEGPFDGIIVTAGAPEIPRVLLDQLAPEGRLVLPVGDAQTQTLVRIQRTPQGFEKTSLGDCRFVKLVGEHGWKE